MTHNTACGILGAVCIAAGVLSLQEDSPSSVASIDVIPLAHQRAAEGADVPEQFRVRNYSGGSCVHASTGTAFRWYGKHDLADYWRKHHHGGEYVACPDCRGTLLQDLDAVGVPYVYTSKGDQKILEFASSTRRLAVIEYYPNHAINFNGFVKGNSGELYARLLDNNRTGRYIYVPKQEFIRKWRGYGGDAVVMLLDPPPPEIK